MRESQSKCQLKWKYRRGGAGLTLLLVASTSAVIAQSQTAPAVTSIPHDPSAPVTAPSSPLTPSAAPAAHEQTPDTSAATRALDAKAAPVGTSLPSAVKGANALFKDTITNYKPLATVVATDIDASMTLSDRQINGLSGILLNIKNNADRPIIFDGDHATAEIGAARVPDAPVSALDPVKVPPDNFIGKLKSDTRQVLLATGTIGGVQAVHDQLKMWGPVLQRYGWDEQRRQNELSRFGKRILWPGDTTSGVLYFEADDLAGAALRMPVFDLYDKSDQALLKLPR